MNRHEQRGIAILELAGVLMILSTFLLGVVGIYNYQADARMIEQAVESSVAADGTQMHSTSISNGISTKLVDQMSANRYAVDVSSSIEMDLMQSRGVFTTRADEYQIHVVIVEVPTDISSGGYLGGVLKEQGRSSAGLRRPYPEIQPTLEYQLKNYASSGSSLFAPPSPVALFEPQSRHDASVLLAAVFVELDCSDGLFGWILSRLGLPSEIRHYHIHRLRQGG